MADTKEPRFHVRNWRTHEVVKTNLSRLDAARLVAGNVAELRIHEGARPPKD